MPKHRKRRRSWKKKKNEEAYLGVQSTHPPSDQRTPRCSWDHGWNAARTASSSRTARCRPAAPPAPLHAALEPPPTSRSS